MTKLFQHIDTVFLPTRNIEKAMDWYVNILGGKPGWKSEHGEYQCIHFGQTSLTLFATNDKMYFQPRRSTFNFYVANAEEAYNYLKQKEVRVDDILEYGAKYFAFFDLDDNCLEVCEY